VKDGQLSIINAERKDSGLYKCKASNQLGFDLAFTQLNVVELPQFTVRPPAQLQKEANQNITVRCQAIGDPQPKVTWMKENGELPVRRSKVNVDGSLKIWNPKVEDSGKYTCIASSNEFFKSVSTMKLTVKRACKPVGVADINTIPDARMTGSTFHGRGSSNPYYPYLGRLNGVRGRGGWCPTTQHDRKDYLQVDMRAVHSVCAVATQGTKDNVWTTSYKLHLSLDGVNWSTYNENNAEKVFSGNTDRNSIVQNSLNSDVRARFVRFYPLTYSGHPCLRVEIFVLK